MVQTQGIAIKAAHTLSAHLLPGTVVVLGGLLAWKLWQQRQYKHKNAEKQTELTQQLDELQDQLDSLKTEQTMATEKPVVASVASLASYSTTAGSGKHTLFKRLINENVAIRAAV